jgi:DNA polymerase III delta' subunit
MKNLALAKLQELAAANTLPHAWLFTGAIDSIKLDTAKEFSKWLLCANRQQHACGVCKSCHLFTAQTHPDFCEITKQPDKSSILIDDVRVLADFIVGKPQFGSHKIVLLHPADAMQKQAANAILKNLEEPAGNTIFLLLAKHPQILLKTIVSRCQVLNFNVTNNEPATRASDIAKMTTDLTALWVYKSVTVVQIVEQWNKQWPNEVLYWFELVLADLIKFKYTRENTESTVAIAALDNVLTANRLWKILENLRQARYWYGTNHNPNLQLILEDLLLTM